MIIRGVKTVCRAIEKEDQPFLHQLNSDPVVRANVVGWEFPSSLHRQVQWFEGHDTGHTQRWIVETRGGEPIGMTGLWDIDWHNRNALTALKLGGSNPRRGVGYGSDAIMAVMCFAFYDIGLARLHSTILSGNAASLHAYTQNCGWTVEGRAREHVWRNGQFVDLLHVGILRRDFDGHPRAREYRDLLESAAEET